MKTGKLKNILIALALPALLSACGSGSANANDPILFYVGSSDGKIEHSIFLCELDPVKQEIAVLDSFPSPKGSGYLALSPDGQILFSTSGVSVAPDEGKNSVASYRVNQENGGLELINRQSSKGRGNCHVYSSPDGSYVFAANYSSGDATAIPVDESGKLGAASSVMMGEGSGPNENRQKGPHAHQVMMDPAGKFLYVPDLGTDKVMNYALDAKTGKLSPNPAQAFLKMEPGSGPRHMAFHPKKKLVFILGEMKASLTACTLDPSTGTLEIINTASIVEEGFDGAKQSAAVRVHPNGKFVYASNRDDVSNLAVFTLNKDGGLVQEIIYKDIPYWPRDFNISPDGKFMLVAGARVNEIALYSIDGESGTLIKLNSSINVPNPTCVLF